jgi:hypothetical protein
MLARTSHPRGSTLLLTVILLVVLTVMGVAAIRLGTQERTNAAAKGRRDALVACAYAARIELFNQLNVRGSGYLDSNELPTEIVLADGTELSAPSARTGSDKDGLTVTELIVKHEFNTAAAAKMMDFTNKMVDAQYAGSGIGKAIVARCRDAKGRELYVEFTTKFAL